MINVLMLSTFSRFSANLAPFDGLHIIIFISINITWIACSLIFGTHKVSRTANFFSIALEIVCTILLNLLIISTGLYAMGITPGDSFSLLAFYGYVLIIICAWRSLYLFSIHLYRLYGYNLRNIAIVGHGRLAEDVIEFMEAHLEYGLTYLGYFDNSYRGPKCLGTLDDLAVYLSRTRIDELYCCLPYLDEQSIKRLISLGERNFINIKLVTTPVDAQLKLMDGTPYQKFVVLEATSFPLEHKVNKVYKRGFDIAFSLVVLGLVGWLFPIIALAIKLESKGPVFFVQRRTGQGNNKFWCLKFRTMYMNDKADKIQATRNDRRMTRIGAFLRKNSLDELPQFFNVLIGNMSVVGPRPYMIHHTKKYSKKLDRFMARYLVRPGITGLAQCSGYRGEITNYISLKNRFKLDYFYISKWSFLFDFGIIAKTVVLLLRGDERAY